MNFKLTTTLACVLAISPLTQAADLRIAFTPGPYRDAFAKGVAPQLEREGYAIKYVEYSLGVRANDATERGEVDANIFQHSVYLEANNRSQKFDLVPIVHVPAPPMGLYSRRHKSLGDVPDGATVTIPSDPVNAARALRILAVAGWVTIKPGVDPVTLSERDLSANVTEDTVKAHMKAILHKLGASDRTHAVTLALRRGIIDSHG